jgi:hypothetical protein
MAPHTHTEAVQSEDHAMSRGDVQYKTYFACQQEVELAHLQCVYVIAVCRIASIEDTCTPQAAEGIQLDPRLGEP